ncbi:MAG TPA: ATP-binding protein, partial [Candidatus Acidoferrum sp.]|nr:ATP-binding protein [Candidatus Acidoferrum sp.]
HLLDLVTDLLDLSLLEAGRKGLELETIPVEPLVREVLDLFSIQATQKGVELRQMVEPALSVVAERRKLVQTLTNLVANAVKFTPEGGVITIAAKQILDPEIGRADPSRQLVELAVADTGTGLLPQDLERIFRGFEQVEVSMTRGHGGAGIGLALVRRLVELHGGRVWAESAGLGHGARFLVHLPFLEAPPPKRVLVVEDQDSLLRALCASVLDAGYTVKGATSGAGALAAISDRQPDLVILDVGLPNAGGWEILRRLRADQRTRGLPVLVLTEGGQAEADRAMSLGASEFLTKPVSTRTLIGIVRELLTGGTPHPGRQASEPDV